MNTWLSEPNTNTISNPSQRLRTTMAAIRLAFNWLGVRKTLSNEQKSQAADTGEDVRTIRRRGFQLVTPLAVFDPEPDNRGNQVYDWDRHKGIYYDCTY